VALGEWVLSMVGTNRSFHHLDSICVPVDMIAPGMWRKCDWEICQDCFALCIETCRHFALIRIFLLITATTAVVIGTIINRSLSCFLTGLSGLWLYLLELTVTYCCSWLIVCCALKGVYWNFLAGFWIKTIKNERP